MANDPNANDGDTSNGTDTPQYVTPDQLNQAINGHVKRLETRLTSTLGNVIADKLKEFTPQPEADAEPETQEQQPSGKVNPEMTALKRQLTTMNNRLQKSEESRAAEATQRRSDGLRSEVLRRLGEGGLSGQQLKAAQAVLYQDGKVRVDEAGTHLFLDSEGTELPLSDGLDSWLGSDESAFFRPPKDVRGSGDQGHRSAVPVTGNSEMDAAIAIATLGAQERLNQ